MFQDMGKISLGSIMMFVYMTLILSKFGWTEIRVALGGLGLLSVGMAFASAIGVCSMLGIPYGPVHTSLPFLLMGLGVDDIFVLMASWRRLQKQLSPMKDVDSIPERMGIMLKSAGASITLTSFTDIVAFSVGSITVSYLFRIKHILKMKSTGFVLAYCRCCRRCNHSVGMPPSECFSPGSWRSHFSWPFSLWTSVAFWTTETP